MILVSLDEPRTSSASLNVWELVLGGPCEVEGPSSCLSGWIVVVQVCGRSFDGLGVWGVCSEVARSVQHVSLHENHCVVSRSRDLHAFRKGVVFAVVERGTSGCVVGMGGSALRTGRWVVDAGGCVQQCWGWGLVPRDGRGWGWCWGVVRWHVLTLYCKFKWPFQFFCPVLTCVARGGRFKREPLNHSLAIGLVVGAVGVGLAAVEWHDGLIVPMCHVVRCAICISEWRGCCSCACVIVSSLVLLVGLLCHGVSIFSLFLSIFSSHPLLLVLRNLLYLFSC